MGRPAAEALQCPHPVVAVVPALLSFHGAQICPGWNELSRGRNPTLRHRIAVCRSIRLSRACSQLSRSHRKAPRAQVQDTVTWKNIEHVSGLQPGHFCPFCAFILGSARVESGPCVSLALPPRCLWAVRRRRHPRGVEILPTCVVIHISFMIFTELGGLDNLRFLALIAHYYFSSSIKGFS